MTIIIYYLGAGNSISAARYEDIKTFSIHGNEVTMDYSETDALITFKYDDIHRVEIIPYDKTPR